MTKKISFALALIASTSAFAQETAPAAPVQTGGLLGKRYAQLGFSYTDVNHSRIDSYAAIASVNVPVVSNFDVSLSFTEAWAEAHSEIDGQALDLAGTYYLTQGDIKPFITGSLGYVFPDLGDELTWGGELGFEYAVNTKTALVLSGGYADNFKKNNEGAFSGTAALHYWFTDKIGAGAAATWLEEGHTSFAAGVSYRF